MKNYLKVVGLIFLAVFSSCEEKNFEMDLPEITFAVNSTGSLPDLIMGERLKISYEIAEEGISNYNDYTLIFSSSENGYLTVNSRDYLAGEKIEVPSLNFIAYYTPTASGEHLITSDITASSNKLVQTSEVSVAVEGASFDFNVTAPIKVTVGETIDLNFAIDELVGESDFDISYAVTGVNAEFKDDNDVVLLANRNYDVENTFKWTLKGIKEGDMNIVFTVTNQFGVEEIKPIPIKVALVDFDFSISTNTTSFFTDKSIPFQIDMNAPNTLTYTMSVDSNTDAFVKYNADFNLGESFAVPNTDFDISYNSSSVGSNIITVTIEGSNGVSVSKTLNIGFKQNIVLEEFTATYRSFDCLNPRTCGGTNSFTKTSVVIKAKIDPTLTLSSIIVKGDFKSTTLNAFTPLGNNEYLIEYLHSTGSNASKEVFFYKDDEVSIELTDSDGNISDILKGTLPSFDGKTGQAEITVVKQ